MLVFQFPSEVPSAHGMSGNDWKWRFSVKTVKKKKRAVEIKIGGSGKPEGSGWESYSPEEHFIQKKKKLKLKKKVLTSSTSVSWF